MKYWIVWIYSQQSHFLYAWVVIRSKNNRCAVPFSDTLCFPSKSWLFHAIVINEIHRIDMWPNNIYVESGMFRLCHTLVSTTCIFSASPTTVLSKCMRHIAVIPWIMHDLRFVENIIENTFVLMHSFGPILWAIAIPEGFTCCALFNTVILYLLLFSLCCLFLFGENASDRTTDHCGLKLFRCVHSCSCVCVYGFITSVCVCARSARTQTKNYFENFEYVYYNQTDSLLCASFQRTKICFEAALNVFAYW